MPRKIQYAAAKDIRALSSMSAIGAAAKLGIPLSYVLRVRSRRDKRGPVPGKGAELRIKIDPRLRAEVLESIAKITGKAKRSKSI